MINGDGSCGRGMLGEAREIESGLKGWMIASGGWQDQLNPQRWT